jgi:hypothetical protein
MEGERAVYCSFTLGAPDLDYKSTPIGNIIAENFRLRLKKMKRYSSSRTEK